MTFTTAFDPFIALGVSRDASSETIKAAYHALSLKYHPSRAQGTEQQHRDLGQHFYHIHKAWKLLQTPSGRRRQVELLNLLELHHDMITRFAEFLNEDDAEDHASSDADEDDTPYQDPSPERPIRRLSRQDRPPAGDRPTALPELPNGAAPRLARSPARRIPKLNITLPPKKPKEADYFAQRRKQLEGLKRKELQAFEKYRTAMIAKFDAEKEAEHVHEAYIAAKREREVFEQTPKQMKERLNAFRGFMGAYNTLLSLGQKEITKAKAKSYELTSPIVAGPDQNQFLRPENGLLRRRSTLRRGYSNDISGDQTSSDSDSDSDSGRRRISPPAHFTPRSMIARRGRVLDTYSSYRPTTGSESHDHNSSNRQVPDGFRMVVRQPTDLGGMSQQDMIGESASDSSRSPSPDPAQSSKSFVVISSNGTASLFDLDGGARSRSPSPGHHRRTSSLTGTKPDLHRQARDTCQFATLNIALAQHHTIPFGHVHLLDQDEKQWLLGAPPDTNTNPRTVMHRLEKLNPSVAAKYTVKADVMTNFNFRLIYNHRNITKAQHQNFIALSYRRKLHVEKKGNHFTLPLEPEIFQAVWNERRSDVEGVWIDQICIDQDSDLERTVSMSAMDLVYRSARAIIVALDDIELEPEQGELLQQHMDEYQSMVYVAEKHRFRGKKPPYLESHDNLYQVIRKMLKSSWFKRAWCRHEMRLARDHIFLVPCRSATPNTGRNILRFDGKCIAYFLALAGEVPFEQEVESIKPALYAFFRDRSKMPSEEEGMSAHHGNFSTVVAEVFAMEAGGDPRIAEQQRQSDARKDKIAIILNTMECGLALQQSLRDPHVLLTDNECYHDLLLVALAAQDPGALCSVGAPLPVSVNSTSWLFQPTVADSGLNNFKTLKRIPSDAVFTTRTSGNVEHFIQLDLKFIKSDLSHHPRFAYDPDYLSLAERFIRICEQQDWGRNRKRYLLKDQRTKRLFGSMHEVYAQTLACVFACGPTWMSDVCQRYSVGRWRADMHSAFELMIALQSTCGRWPEDQWGGRAAGFLMDFVNFLVIRGLPLRQLSKPETWRPVWTTSIGTGKVIAFVPDGKEIRTAVPTVLATADYVHLARLWILEPRPGEGNRVNGVEGDEWTLLGKSVVFSDEESVEHMHQVDGDFRKEQKVFGRTTGLQGAVPSRQ